MHVIEYVDYFHYFARHAKFIMTIEYQRVYCFVQSLRLTISINIKSLVIMAKSFADISNYSLRMKEIHHVDQWGNNKRRRYQGRISEIHSSSNLEVVVLKVSTLYVSYFNIRVSIVYSFRPLFKLQIEVCLVLVIILAMVGLRVHL